MFASRRCERSYYRPPCSNNPEILVDLLLRSRLELVYVENKTIETSMLQLRHTRKYGQTAAAATKQGSCPKYSEMLEFARERPNILIFDECPEIHTVSMTVYGVMF